MGEDLNRDKPKIAVITVHGVADQAPHNSARALASLLLNHNQSEKQVQYTPFYESTLRLPVRPVMMDKGLPASDHSPQDSSNNQLGFVGRTIIEPLKEKVRTAFKQNPLDERGAYIDNCLQIPRYWQSNKEFPADIQDVLDQRAHHFIGDQLREYKGEGVGSTYETVRLEGSRLGRDNKPQLDVHVYEMYWADLSRLGTGFIRIVGEFYQLLFHLSSLGREAVDLARIEYQDTFGQKNTWWNLYSWAQAWAGRMLSVFIPILNLYLLLVTPIPLSGNIPAQYLPLVALSSLGLLSVVLTGYWLFQRQQKTLLPLWAMLPFLVAVVVIGLGYGLLEERFSPWLRLGYYQFLALEWCALSALILWLLIRGYARRRPGAREVTTIIGVFLAGMIIKLLLSAQDSHEGITDAAFKTVEVIYLGLVFSWFLFCFLQVAAALLGSVAVRQSTAEQPNPNPKENKERPKRAQRAVWTARLTLAVPSALFIIVTFALWILLDLMGSQLLPKEKFYTPWLFLTNRSEIPFSGPEFVHRLIVAAASPFFIFILLSLLLAVLLAIWSLFPAIWSEINPPQSDNPESDDQLSDRFGEWMTQGLQLIYGGSSFSVFFAMAILFPIACVDSLIGIFNPQIAANFKLTEEMLGILDTTLVASTTGFVAFRVRLDNFLLGFRNVLDIILDVDNYLRRHPLDGNPRARIYARYVSVLRYLCCWQDPQDSRGYDAIVIVAHSQGSVITADLLRFLQRETKPDTDPALNRLVNGNLPIYFFTMGCPLRQLYGTSFPHLYNWARHYYQEEQQLSKSKRIGNEQKPEPTKLLGVTRWVNTFRSADYVGRYLWRSDACKFQPRRLAGDNEDTTWTSDRDRPANILEDEKLTRREFCLGAGAHTHYWDGTSNQVAAEINILIREAYRETRKKRIQTAFFSSQRYEE